MAGGQLEKSVGITGDTDSTDIGNVGDRLKVDISGNRGGVYTSVTYAASVINLVTGTLATDVFTITGSGTKTVYVMKMSVSGLAVTGGNFTVDYLKRSTANTGGTSTTPTVVPLDSTFAAGTAVVKAYTVNPTLGTLVGAVRSNRVFVSGGATTASQDDIDIWGELASPVVLRGTSESLCVNLNGVTINSPTMNIWVEWVEV